VRFTDLRGDWYRGGDLMARLLARSAAGEGIEFTGFPRQWIPFFELCGARWSACVPPPDSVPVASDLSDEQLLGLVAAARRRGQARTLVEAWAALDPLLADVLYRLDRLRSAVAAPEPYLPLTGWQSYGRPEIQAFDRLVLASASARISDTAVILPCARARPYDRSRTHRRIWRDLAGLGVAADSVDALVVSSIGVVPQSLWDHPVALAYDSGVPDIWRVYRLLRAYLQQARYRDLVDCTEFPPYAECLRLLALDGLVDAIRAGPKRRLRRLPRP
jgi:predicted RNA-binding protein